MKFEQFSPILTWRFTRKALGNLTSHTFVGLCFHTFGGETPFHSLYTVGV